MMRQYLMALCVMAAAAGASRGGEPVKKTWSFDDDAPGKIAAGFESQVGEWSVVQIDKGRALAQTAKNANSVFNVVLVNDTKFADVDLTVKLKAIAGGFDQGGGLVWRASDGRNYYVARYNPLEDNYRLYHVVNGKRTLIQNADIKHSDGWHTLRVVMKGKHIECYYDGKKYLEQDDGTIPTAGKIGLWSKADAQSQFDDFTVSGE